MFYCARLKRDHSCRDVILSSLNTFFSHYVAEGDGYENSNGNAHSYAHPDYFFVDPLVRSSCKKTDVMLVTILLGGLVINLLKRVVNNGGENEGMHKQPAVIRRTQNKYLQFWLFVLIVDVCKFNDEVVS